MAATPDLFRKEWRSIGGGGHSNWSHQQHQIILVPHSHCCLEEMHPCPRQLWFENKSFRVTGFAVKPVNPVT